jgi:hypothetical protein
VEDGGETESKGNGDGETKRAHTALDDEVGAEFREKWSWQAATLGQRAASKGNGPHLSLQEGDGGGGGALVV